MRKISLLIVLITLIFTLSGCYDKKEVNDMAYIIALGFDIGKVNEIRLTLQYIAAPSSGGNDGGGKGSKTSVNHVTIDIPSLYSGLDMVSNFIGKRVNMSHAKLIVFSEEFVKHNLIVSYIHAIIRNREFRPNAYIGISRGTAQEYLQSIRTVQEFNPAKYYELIFSSFEYSGLSPGVQLKDFYNDLESGTNDAGAILLGVNHYNSTDDFSKDKSDYKKRGYDFPLEGNFKAGDLPRVGSVRGEAMGFAVFDGSIFVGELDGDETTYYLMLKGKFQNSYFTLPDPRDNKKIVVVNVFSKKSADVKIELENDIPKINVKLNLEADFVSIRSGENYEIGSDKSYFEKAVSKFFEKQITDFLYKTSKEFHSDVCGIGKNIRKKFLTYDKLKNFNWLQHYPHSTFKVNVSFIIRRPGLIVRSMPAPGSEGVYK